MRIFALMKMVKIHSIKMELERRVKIYHLWLENLESTPASTELHNIYHYLKHEIGLALPQHEEVRLAGLAQKLKRAEVSRQELESAESYGLFDGLNLNGWSKWRVVGYGRLACLALFNSFGTNSQELLEAMDVQLVVGKERLATPPDGAGHVIGLYRSGKTLEEIIMATGMPKAIIFAILWLVS